MPNRPHDRDMMLKFIYMNVKVKFGTYIEEMVLWMNKSFTLWGFINHGNWSYGKQDKNKAVTQK